MSAIGMDTYLATLAKYPPLPREEERAVARAARAGDAAARDRLITHNLQFVVHVVKRYKDRGIAFEDLISEGNCGLCRAADRFDPEQDVKFISYAVWWIKQAVLLALAIRGEALGLPPSRASDVYRIAKVEGELRTSLGRDPDDAEIAKAAGNGMSAEVVASLRAAHNAPILGFDDSPTGADGVPLKDRLSVDEEMLEMERRLEGRLQRESIERALDSLPKRDADILRLYFGLSGGREFTLEEVAQALGITRERVRQLRDRALAKVRANLQQMSLPLA